MNTLYRSHRSWSCVVLIALALSCAAAWANDWDERLEGTLPLPVGYTLEVAEPNSGVTSVICDTGEVALHLMDSNYATRQGRINRGNWSNVSGYTLHTRFRVLMGNDVMALQCNDGLASGRFQLRWGSGRLSILQSIPDAGQPSYIDMPAGEWVELWVKVSDFRYWLYTFTGGSWTLYSVGSCPVGSGGAVYLGSASASGTGSMDLDFWRLETTGGYAPGDAGAPCIPPNANLTVGATANPVARGQSASITVAGSEPGVSYQLRKTPGNENVGSPVAGTGGLIALPTGPLTATTAFNVLATSLSGGACSTQLKQTQTIIVAEPVASIADAKSYPDGAVVQLPGKPVSVSTPSAFWIEETDRGCGIRVNSTSFPSVGRIVSVTGTLGTAAGERYIDCLSWNAGDQGSAPRPVGMGLRDLGGRELNAHSPGVEGASGPNNLGLLVRVWGKVTSLGSGYYYVDDGSGLLDGTTTEGSPNVGVRVLAAPGSTEVGAFVRLTGISTGFLDASSRIRRALIPLAADCALPNAGLAVDAADPVICSGASTTIRVSGSEIGVTYQLRASPGNTNIGAPVAGTGGTIALPTGPVTSAATFNVLATRDAGGCAVQLSQTAAVSVNPLPDAGLTVGALANPVFPGETAKITVLSSQNGVVYQLRNNADNSHVGGPVSGNGGTIQLPTGPLSATTTYNILATNVSTGCAVQLAATKTITVGSRSKIGLHAVCCQSDFPNYMPFLYECSNAERPVAMVKVVDDFSTAGLAKQVNPATLTIGRVNAANGFDLQGLDYVVGWGYTPQQGAQWYYNQVKPIWQANRASIDVWECCNEWSWHWAWQADFFIEMMNLAEADGFRIGLWACSVGNPPEEYYPEIARTCVRARAHGNHILCLHEYGLWAPPGEEDALLKNAGPSLVTRYRRLYSYLEQQNAVIPLALTEVGENGGGGFTGTEVFVDDFAWYDQQMRQDSYVIGCAAWTLGDWSGANFNEALPALADYITTH